MYYYIDENLARKAMEAYSHRDYKDGETTAGYQKSVDEIYKILENKKEQYNLSDIQKEKLDKLADRYSKKYAAWINKHNSNEANCPSILISGAGNFNTKKKNQQNARRDTLVNELDNIELIKQEIIEYKPSTIILANDENVIEKLEQRITELTANHGSRYEINCTKKRLENIKKEKETEGNNYNTSHLNLTIIENKENMRLQILFNERPDEKTRTLLKSHAFRWAPSQNAWQRQLTNNARHSTNLLIRKLEELRA